MNFYNFHVNDFRGATWHLNRLQRSIYRDLIDEYYLQEKPLTKDVAVLAHKMGCHSDEEKAALALVLGEFFTLKNGVYRHKRIDHEIKNYQYRHATPATKCNAATQDETNATQHATDMQRECNANTLRSRKSRTLKRLREKFGLNVDNSMTLQELEALENELLGKTATQHATPATPHATDMQRECNAENPSITKNQEPRTKNIQQQQSHETEKNFSQPENPIDLPTPFDRFAMHSNWQPHDLANVNALLRRAKLPAYETGLMLDAALDFVAYWSARPERECTAAEWDADFVKSAVQFRAKYGHKYDTQTWELLPSAMPKPDVADHAEKPQSGAGSRTKQSLLALNAIRQAITSGRVKFGLPETVSVAIVDGLTSLVSARLKYPPPADTWTEAFGEWHGAFECCVKEVRTNEMNPIVNAQTIAQAFQAAKKQATQKDQAEPRFPSVRDVIGHLPKQLVRAAEHQFQPEKWQQEQAEGRVKAAELLKNISKNRIQVA